MKPSQRTAARESRLFNTAWIDASSAARKAKPAASVGQNSVSRSSQSMLILPLCAMPVRRKFQEVAGPRDYVSKVGRNSGKRYTRAARLDFHQRAHEKLMTAKAMRHCWRVNCIMSCRTDNE